MTRRALAFAVVILAPCAARADAGAAFAETSRVASLADAVSARPGDAGTLAINPAGLADLREGEIVFGGHADYVAQWVQRTAEPTATDRSRGFGGIAFAAATPLPGPDWARRFGVGVALDVPAQYLLHLDVPVRVDEPTSPIYDSRPDKISASFALGYKLFKGVELGIGFAISPTLSLPTLVQYQAGRAPSVNDNVEVRIDSSLDLAVSPVLGLRLQPFDWLGLSLVWREAQVSRATGTQTTQAGGIVAPDKIAFFQMWEPATLVIGTAIAPVKNVSWSLDVTWRKWSDMRSAFDEPLSAPYQFNDTLSIASGLEVKLPHTAWALRGGVGVEPTPIPTQTGPTNYLGANTFIASLGAGYDLRRVSKIPLVVDAHLRARFGATQSVTKDPNAMTDADPTLPGQQIDNMGFPGFRSQAIMMQAGLTGTFFLGGTP